MPTTAHQAETNSTQRSVLHHRDGRVSHAGHAATDSDCRPRSDTSVVFCDSAHLFSPHRLPVCSVSHLRRVSCRVSGRLLASRGYPRSPCRRHRVTSGSIAVSGPVCRPGVFLPGTTPAVSIVGHQGSVRVQTVWFDDGCHCTLHADRQRFCPRLFF